MKSFPVVLDGVIQKSGITIYMYGTHTITSNSITYALQSSRVNLDLYIHQEVLVKGIRVEGYPVDDGPEFIDVRVVEKK